MENPEELLSVASRDWKTLSCVILRYGYVLLSASVALESSPLGPRFFRTMCISEMPAKITTTLRGANGEELVDCVVTLCGTRGCRN